MDSPYRILHLDHVVIRARDPAALERFYVDVLGCTVERRQEKFGLTQLRAGGSLIDLIAAPDEAPGRNMDHLCLRIEPFDGKALATYFGAHGIEVGEVVPRYGAEGQGPSVYLHDPEGNQVELKGPPGPV